MIIYTLSLDFNIEDVKNDEKLNILDIKDNSAEGVYEFITECIPGIIEESIKIYCHENDTVRYATFTTEENNGQKLHWVLKTRHLLTVKKQDGRMSVLTSNKQSLL